MVCPRCGKDNESSAQFCSRCGLEFAQVVASTQDTSDIKYCYRHPKEATRLSCGRCERPICTKCVVIGPAGPRCPECAKQNVKVSARGVSHDITSRLRGIGRGGPMSIYFWILILSMVAGLVRGCFWHPSRQVPDEEYEPPAVERKAPPT